MTYPRSIAALLLCLPLAAFCAENSESDDDEMLFDSDSFEGLELRGIGPALMSGRIADIAIHPKDRSVWYVAVGSGNLWKTTNAGTSWTPIFDDEGSYSIGCVTIDPNDHNTVWIGTGENVGGRHVGYGDGIYKSRDGGESWERMGLENSEHIGTIVVDPRDSKVVYAAAQGPLWSAGGERGLYKTVDGGSSWEKILGEGDYTGVNEVRMDPRNPDVLYASTHQRYRNVAALINGGPGSGIHKSTDGGATWQELSEGLPEEDMGKIGLAISPQRPDIIYATIELAHREGGFWRSEDGGENWEKRNEYVSGATGPHYYQEIFASPHKFDRVYQMDHTMHVSDDGGENFSKVPHDNKHVDHHALAFLPDDPDYLLSGTDGGLYESWDLGKTWKFVANLPVTQFYKVAVDYDEPYYNVYGGTQDNNTQGGPSRTVNNGGIRNSDWFVTLFGDGHQPAVDPSNPDIVYSEWQQGNLTRYDRKTGESIYIQPQPAKDEPWDRFNWDAPILLSPHDPARLYYASQRVWRSNDRGDSWRPVSGDLSRGLDRLRLPMMGAVQSIDSLWDVYAMSKYATITSLAESPLEEGLLYAGTDDGLLQVSEDGGGSWRRIDELPGVKDFFFVNDVKADLHDASTVYAVVDHHKEGDFSPYVFKSTDRGRSWRSIAGDLPERHIVWRLVQDHVNPNLLFAGTEFGVFFTIDGGSRWVKLTGGVPNIPFRDLAIQRRENDLVGATFGRGFFVFDDYTPLRQVSDAMLEEEARLFPVRDTRWYQERKPLGNKAKASQGDAFFTAPNPPFGAVFTYYLGEEIKTRKKMRRDKEKEIAKDGGDNPYPGWETIAREDLEEDPSILLTVRDSDGEIVRRLSGPVEAGFHRVAWDLRHPSLEPWVPEEEREESFFPVVGVLAPPGTYTVSIAKRVDGKLVELGQSESFDVVSIVTPTLEGSSPEEMVAFARRVDHLNRAAEGTLKAIDERLIEFGAINEALMRSGAGDLDDRARDIEKRFKTLRDRIATNEKRDKLQDPGPLSIQDRIFVASLSKRYSTYGPTPTHRQSIEIAEELFSVAQRDFDAALSDLEVLREAMDEAGVPWTPGRGVPR